MGSHRRSKEGNRIEANCSGGDAAVPDSLPSLDIAPSEPVREKAIEFANALLEEGMEEGKAIRIAIAKAKEWAERHLG